MSDQQPRQAEQFPVVAPDLRAFLEHRVSRTADEFSVDPTVFPRPVMLIERPDESPEIRRVPGGACVIFITNKSDWQQSRYQIAHEVVHGVLSSTVEPVFDWVQEMFAVHIAVRAMRELGEYRYASRNEAGLWEKSHLLTRQQMLDADLAEEYPEGLYGQAFVTGCELIDQIGWERLKLLGTQLDNSGRHDIAKWLELLDTREQATVEEILFTNALEK